MNIKGLLSSPFYFGESPIKKYTVDVETSFYMIQGVVCGRLSLVIPCNDIISSHLRIIPN